MMARSLQRLRARDERGAGVIEWAIIAPLVLMLLFGTAELALVIAGNNAGSNAAREGARRGLIDYRCADAYDGSLNADGVGSAGFDASCTTVPSAQYQTIRDAARKRLGGLVSGNISVHVRCLDGTASPPGPKNCGSAIVPDTDLIEVRVKWNHLGITKFLPTTLHDDTARMVVAGLPDLSTTTTATTSSTTTTPPTTTTTTTLLPTTTTTAAPTTTTTTVPCSVSNIVLSPPSPSRSSNGNKSATLSGNVTVSFTATGGGCSSLKFSVSTAGATQNGNISGVSFTIPGGDSNFQFDKRATYTVAIVGADGTTVLGSVPMTMAN